MSPVWVTVVTLATWSLINSTSSWEVGISVTCWLNMKEDSSGPLIWQIIIIDDSIQEVLALKPFGGITYSWLFGWLSPPFSFREEILGWIELLINSGIKLGILLAYGYDNALGTYCCLINAKFKANLVSFDICMLFRNILKIKVALWKGGCETWKIAPVSSTPNCQQQAPSFHASIG